jgi:hypothetical protein
MKLKTFLSVDSTVCGKLAMKFSYLTCMHAGLFPNTTEMTSKKANAMVAKLFGC